MTITLYAGPLCGQEQWSMTPLPDVGATLSFAGAYYVYAGRGRFVHIETLEAHIILEDRKSKRRK